MGDLFFNEVRSRHQLEERISGISTILPEFDKLLPMTVRIPINLTDSNVNLYNKVNQSNYLKFWK